MDGRTAATAGRPSAGAGVAASAAAVALRKALQQIQRQTEADLERLWQNALELVEALLSLPPGKKTNLSCVFVLTFVAHGDINYL